MCSAGLHFAPHAKQTADLQRVESRHLIRYVTLAPAQGVDTPTLSLTQACSSDPVTQHKKHNDEIEKALQAVHSALVSETNRSFANPPTSPERRACGTPAILCFNSSNPAMQPPPAASLQQPAASLPGQQDPMLQCSRASRIRCCSLPIGPGFAPQLPLASWPANSQLPACQDSRIRCCSLPIGPGFALQLPLAPRPASSQLLYNYR